MNNLPVLVRLDAVVDIVTGKLSITELVKVDNPLKLILGAVCVIVLFVIRIPHVPADLVVNVNTPRLEEGPTPAMVKSPAWSIPLYVFPPLIEFVPMLVYERFDIVTGAPELTVLVKVVGPLNVAVLLTVKVFSVKALTVKLVKVRDELITIGALNTDCPVNTVCPLNKACPPNVDCPFKLEGPFTVNVLKVLRTVIVVLGVPSVFGKSD